MAAAAAAASTAVAGAGCSELRPPKAHKEEENKANQENEEDDSEIRPQRNQEDDDTDHEEEEEKTLVIEENEMEWCQEVQQEHKDDAGEDNDNENANDYENNDSDKDNDEENEEEAADKDYCDKYGNLILPFPPLTKSPNEPLLLERLEHAAQDQPESPQRQQSPSPSSCFSPSCGLLLLQDKDEPQEEKEEDYCDNNGPCILPFPNNNNNKNEPSCAQQQDREEEERAREEEDDTPLQQPEQPLPGQPLPPQLLQYSKPESSCPGSQADEEAKLGSTLDSVKIESQQVNPSFSSDWMCGGRSNSRSNSLLWLTILEEEEEEDDDDDEEDADADADVDTYSNPQMIQSNLPLVQNIVALKDEDADDNNDVNNDDDDEGNNNGDDDVPRGNEFMLVHTMNVQVVSLVNDLGMESAVSASSSSMESSDGSSSLPWNAFHVSIATGSWADYDQDGDDDDEEQSNGSSSSHSASTATKAAPMEENKVVNRRELESQCLVRNAGKGNVKATTRAGQVPMGWVLLFWSMVWLAVLISIYLLLGARNGQEVQKHLIQLAKSKSVSPEHCLWTTTTTT
ncbi:hypothetical protein ACA910_013058 [Epithemia clementina (nom. ined.)]